MFWAHEDLVYGEESAGGSFPKGDEILGTRAWLSSLAMTSIVPSDIDSDSPIPFSPPLQLL